MDVDPASLSKWRAGKRPIPKNAKKRMDAMDVFDIGQETRMDDMDIGEHAGNPDSDDARDIHRLKIAQQDEERDSPAGQPIPESSDDLEAAVLAAQQGPPADEVILKMARQAHEPCAAAYRTCDRLGMLEMLEAGHWTADIAVILMYVWGLRGAVREAVA